MVETRNKDIIFPEKEKFNLSEHIGVLDFESKKSGVHYEFLTTDFIKEFIKRVKDLIPDEIEDECPECKCKYKISPIMEKEEIDKLAGDKLKET